MLLDSVIVIDCLNRIPSALDFVRAQTVRPSVSLVTWAEVFAGVSPAGEADTRRYLGAFRLLPLDQAIAERAGRLRQSERWKLPDALQAATAQHHGLQLVTRNTKDFKPERHPFVVVPYTI